MYLLILSQTQTSLAKRTQFINSGVKVLPNGTKLLPLCSLLQPTPLCCPTKLLIIQNRKCWMRYIRVCPVHCMFRHMLYVYREKKKIYRNLFLKQTSKSTVYPFIFPALVSLEVLFLNGNRIIWRIVVHHNQQMHYYHQYQVQHSLTIGK